MKESNIHAQFIKISVNFVGQRVDNFLLCYLKTVPKSMIYRIIRTGVVRVNKKRIKFYYKLRIGDILKIPIIKNININKCNIQSLEEIKFLESFIIYEDDCFLAINKPAGIAVHGGSGLKFGVIEGLRMLRPRAQFLELVHRLDRETSGVLLVAKNRTFLLYLNEQLRLKNIEKKYLALVHGVWDASLGTVSKSLLKTNVFYTSNKKIMRVVSRNGKIATTHFQIIEKYANTATYLDIRPITGRTHQIRVHAQYAQHPIIGDKIYGNYEFDIKFKQFGFNRLFLHAYMLCFIHPYTKKFFFVQASLDQLFYDCLFFLRNLATTRYISALKVLEKL
ncbi:23S rRNA pseudouridine(955/2504/2580) synthase RluC [Candidatus Blochmannia ocreatus (nom. nud.)]|uniref:Pseudouridine synthase n=1 Tax=Candidatus Blochmannia ocreatus (nom. nud.) TaxID=251538 RepID=A0ABY4SV23_9ENTR|nr:23S rRNA pseudouridine(955/2504/2580) synthase RluC [Candidatus Blochmannia ocreatus]URJ24913.1 23S rRNA pseudouridine(955/2504/2580) synthase RluC [Candidatus Blochmannia ocreatus]